MIRVTTRGLNVSLSGAVVYLDNWAFIELATKDPLRRRRFIDAVHTGIDVLFSVANAAELSGPQGRSADALKAFLDDIGPRWFPARLDVTTVVKLEIKGESPDKACIDEQFFKSHIADQIRPYTADCGKLIPVTDDFFRLGPLLERVGRQRVSIAEASAIFDELLKVKMRPLWEDSRHDPAFLDRKFPRVPFNPAMPASFVYFNLLRVMALEAHALKKGDGMDFCHAVIACAFSSFATLDKQWKRRIANLPPNKLARVYSPPELDQMVTDMESWLRHRAT